MPKLLNLTAYRGDKLEFTLTFPSSSFLTGATVLAQVRETPDSDLVDTFTSSIAGAVLTLSITPDYEGEYMYDVEVTLDGVAQTYVYGKLIVQADISYV